MSTMETQCLNLKFLSKGVKNCTVSCELEWRIITIGFSGLDEQALALSRWELFGDKAVLSLKIWISRPSLTAKPFLLFVPREPSEYFELHASSRYPQVYRHFTVCHNIRPFRQSVSHATIPHLLAWIYSCNSTWASPFLMLFTHSSLLHWITAWNQHDIKPIKLIIKDIGTLEGW